MDPIEIIKKVMDNNTYPNGWEQLHAARSAYTLLDSTSKERINRFLKDQEISERYFGSSDRLLLIGYLNIPGSGGILVNNLSREDVPNSVIYDALGEVKLSDDKKIQLLAHLEKVLGSSRGRDYKSALQCMANINFESAIPYMQRDLEEMDLADLAHIAIALTSTSHQTEEPDLQTRLKDIAAGSDIRERKAKKVLEQFISE